MEILGAALPARRCKQSGASSGDLDVVLATKVYNVMGPGPNDRGASRGHIMDGVKASLTRLGMDYIDLYQIHALDQVSTPVEENHARAGRPGPPGTGTLYRRSSTIGLAVANHEGVIGISERHGWSRLESLQAYYTLAGRDLEREIVPLIEDQKVGLMVWSPLAGGLLSGKYRADQPSPEGARRTAFDFPLVDKPRAWRVLDVMRPIAEAHGVSHRRAWRLPGCCRVPEVCQQRMIIGAKTMGQLG